MPTSDEKSLIERAIEYLQQSSGPFWEGAWLDFMRTVALQGKDSSPADWPCESDLATEEVLRAMHEQSYARPDDPYLYPGAILAWHNGGFAVRIAGDTAQAFLDGDADFLTTDGLLDAIWPCALFDLDFFGCLLHNIRVRAVLCYPTYDVESGQKAIGVLGFDPDGVLGATLCAKISVKGTNYDEMAQITEEDHTRECGQARLELAGITPQTSPFTIYDPLEVEPSLAQLAIMLISTIDLAAQYETSYLGETPVRTYTTVASESLRAELLTESRNHRKNHLQQESEQKAEFKKAVADEVERRRSEAIRLEAAAARQAAEMQRQAEEKARRRLEQEEKAAQRAAAREEKAKERARRKAENIAAAKRKALAKAERLAEKERQRAEEAELAAIGNAIRKMQDEEDALAADQPSNESITSLDYESANTVSNVEAPLSDTEILASCWTDSHGEDSERTQDDFDSLSSLGDSNNLSARDNANEPNVQNNANEPNARDNANELGTFDKAPSPGSSSSTAADLAWMTYELKRLKEENNRLAAEVEALADRAVFAETMQIPSSAAEVLEMALDAFPDRIAVTPSASKSADEYQGDIAEMWQVLQAMACVLHPLVFDQTNGSLTREFQSSCGFELTLRDVKQEKRLAQASGSRKVEWKGQMRDFTPHVKGKSVKRGQTLRVHFFADYEDEVLVIAHCGEHLESSMTARL